MDPVPAIVLAGGRASAEFAAAAGVENRALAEIAGRPMVSYVLRALHEARTVRRVVLVAPPGFPSQAEADETVTSDEGLVENIQAGISQCADSEYVLIATADLPFLQAASVDDYTRACAATGADCCYAAVTRAACARRFPGMKRTYLHTTAGSVTGGNVVFQRAASYPRQAALLRQAYARRKNPLFLASLIGPANVLKLLAGRLTLKDIETAASRAIGVRCRLIVTEHADLGTDIDRPEDLQETRRLFSEHCMG